MDKNVPIASTTGPDSSADAGNPTESGVPSVPSVPKGPAEGGPAMPDHVPHEAVVGLTTSAATSTTTVTAAGPTATMPPPSRRGGPTGPTTATATATASSDEASFIPHGIGIEGSEQQRPTLELLAAQQQRELAQSLEGDKPIIGLTSRARALIQGGSNVPDDRTDGAHGPVDDEEHDEGEENSEENCLCFSSTLVISSFNCLFASSEHLRGLCPAEGGDTFGAVGEDGDDGADAAEDPSGSGAPAPDPSAEEQLARLQSLHARLGGQRPLEPVPDALAGITSGGRLATRRPRISPALLTSIRRAFPHRAFDLLLPLAEPERRFIQPGVGDRADSKQLVDQIERLGLIRRMTLAILEQLLTPPKEVPTEVIRSTGGLLVGLLEEAISELEAKRRARLLESVRASQILGELSLGLSTLPISGMFTREDLEQLTSQAESVRGGTETIAQARRAGRPAAAAGRAGAPMRSGLAAGHVGGRGRGAQGRGGQHPGVVRAVPEKRRASQQGGRKRAKPAVPSDANKQKKDYVPRFFTRVPAEKYRKKEED